MLPWRKTHHQRKNHGSSWPTKERCATRDPSGDPTWRGRNQTHSGAESSSSPRAQPGSTPHLSVDHPRPVGFHTPNVATSRVRQLCLPGLLLPASNSIPTFTALRTGTVPSSPSTVPSGAQATKPDEGTSRQFCPWCTTCTGGSGGREHAFPDRSPKAHPAQRVSRPAVPSLTLRHGH